MNFEVTVDFHYFWGLFMFCKVTVITEVANTLVTLFLSANQYMTLFDVCFCFKTPYWIHTVNSRTWDWQTAALCLTSGQSVSHMHLAVRHVTASWIIGALALALSREGNTRHRNVKNMAFSSVRKRHSVRAETRRQSPALFDLSWECACLVTQVFFPLCTCPQMTMKAQHVLILELEINWANLQMRICE